MSYPNVTIVNSTKFPATGEITFSVHSGQSYQDLDQWKTWEGTDRGGFLLREVTAHMTMPNGVVEATPFKSTGTSYSHYAIIQIKPGEFAVTRIAHGNRNLKSEDYVEPIEKEK